MLVEKTFLVLCFLRLRTAFAPQKLWEKLLTSRPAVRYNAKEQVYAVFLIAFQLRKEGVAYAENVSAQKAPEKERARFQKENVDGKRP